MAGITPQPTVSCPGVTLKIKMPFTTIVRLLLSSNKSLLHIPFHRGWRISYKSFYGVSNIRQFLSFYDKNMHPYPSFHCSVYMLEDYPTCGSDSSIKLYFVTFNTLDNISDLHSQIYVPCTDSIETRHY